MTRFHVNAEGNPGRCSAVQGHCPFGADAPHFATRAAAQAGFEAAMGSPFGVSSPSSVHAPEPELLWVEDSAGDGSDMVAGELSEDALWLFRNGQCLGLATTLAREFGTGEVVMVTNEEEGEDLAWDDEANEPLLDEHGQKYSEVEVIPHHAYAVAPDGQLWDCDGPISLERVEADAVKHNRGIHRQGIDDTNLKFGGFMVEQNTAFAEAAIPEILARAKASVSEAPT